jgi:hypothetical protein
MKKAAPPKGKSPTADLAGGQPRKLIRVGVGKIASARCRRGTI